MDDRTPDLHDYRGRLLRLAVALAIATLVTVFLMRWIRSVSAEPNTDPLGASMVGFVGLLIFVLTAAAVARTISAIAARLARR
jgi:ABC-type multidrug transport system fused ATPase/permease subunit